MLGLAVAGACRVWCLLLIRLGVILDRPGRCNRSLLNDTKENKIGLVIDGIGSYVEIVVWDARGCRTRSSVPSPGSALRHTLRQVTGASVTSLISGPPLRWQLSRRQIRWCQHDDVTGSTACIK